MARPDLREADRDILGEGWLSDEPYRNVEAMSEIGSRFGGTESEKTAVKYMLAKMQEYGFENVHTEEFTYTGWIRGTAGLGVTSPVTRQLDCIGLPHTGTFDVEGEVVNLGYGTPGEFESNADRIKGRIVLVDAKSPSYFRRGIHRLEKYGRSVSSGAIGFIWMRDQGGHLAETGGLRAHCEIPGIGVTKEVGEGIKRLMSRGPVRVRIATENTVRDMPSWNVVGDIPGRTLKDHVVIIGAHFDGHDIATGSMDDASGAAVVMEAGRLLGRHRRLLRRTVRLICFPVEEIGLLGSFAYCRAHQGELDEFDFMLNLDGAGRDGDKGMALQGFTELIPFFKEVSRDMKWPMICDNAFGMNSDMYPFSLEGVPSASLSVMEVVRTGRDYGHTAADTLDKVSSKWLRHDSLLVARTMLRMAAWEDVPVRHKAKDEIKKIMHDAGLLEVLRYTGRYPFKD
jgi:Zn-dependent M28 family amino/carboxypeptidase